jgi:hypothetical protein
MSNWIPLNDYATKHDISVSTLRRRIKSQKIQFKLDEGKYFILEDGQARVGNDQAEQPINFARPVITSSEPILTTKLLLDELKRAYLDSLQSKEDQILHLKQQVSDLKTLVMILEKENNRMQGGE